MKRYLSNGMLPVWFMALLFAGCIKDTTDCTGTEGRARVVTTLSVAAPEASSTYATEMGTTRENRITQVWGGNTSISSEDLTWTPDANNHLVSNPVSFEVAREGLVAGDTLSVFANQATPPHLTLLPQPPFYMSGRGPITGTSGNFAATVHLLRGVAKIRLAVRSLKSGLGIGNIWVQPQHVPDRIRPFAIFQTDSQSATSDPDEMKDPAGLNYMTWSGEFVLSSAFTENVVMEDGTSQKCYPIYVYENYLERESDYDLDVNVTKLKVQITVQDQQTGVQKIFTQIIPIRTQDADTGDWSYRIKRNHIYTVDVQITGLDKVQAHLSVLDWDKAEVSGDILGTELSFPESPIFLKPGQLNRIPVHCNAGSLSAAFTDNTGFYFPNPGLPNPQMGPAGFYKIDGKDSIYISVFCPYDANTNWMRASAGNILAPTVTVYPERSYSFGIVSQNPVSFGLEGGNFPIAITSFYKDYSANPVTPPMIEVPWTAEFSVDGGTTWTSAAPDGLSGLPASGLEGGNFTVTVGAAPNTSSSTHTAALRAATRVSDYDLSTKGGTAVQNTANCYLVNAPGTYRLPLVYGNAIKDGLPNASAYSSTSGSGSLLNPLVNHGGAPILVPYIPDHAGCAPVDCCLVWQDTPGLVSSVQLSADGQYLTFEVLQSSIRQGNAIVAVRDAAGTIMWSWHIWVTDYKLDTNLTAITNFEGIAYTFLPYNIGWCDAETATYSARSILVRITQADSGFSKTITINQTGGTVTTTVSNPYFQWGRKDPMLPGLYGSSLTVPMLDKACYTDTDKPSYSFQETGLSSLSPADYIKQPYCFADASSYNDKSNLWSMNNTRNDVNNDPVVKTVYDPSPVGYCVPPSGAWTGFTTTGQNVGNDYNVNAILPWDRGFYFYCRPNKLGGTVFYPSMGRREATNGSLMYGYVGGYYWSAIPNGYSQGREMKFGTSTASPRSGDRRGYGYSVRPIKE